MIKTFRYKLYPNNKQNSRMFEIASATRYAYNWALDYAMNYFVQNHKFISEFSITKEFTKHKKIETWLNNIPNNSLKQSVKNGANTVHNVYMNNKKYKTNNKPHFKKKFSYTPTIFLDSCQVVITDNSVKLDKLSLSKKANKVKFNYVRISNKHKIPKYLKSYINPTVSFDGFNWYITIGINIEDISQHNYNDGIGIDLGIKTLATCSNNINYININKTSRVKQLEKRLKREQRSFSRKLEKNKLGNKIIYSKNMIKQKSKIKYLHKQLTDIRDNHIHQVTTSIIKQKPRFIAMEDLNIVGMMKNKHLAKHIQQSKFYMFKRVISYKAEHYNISLVNINRFYPSSKTCSACGWINKQLQLKDRIFKCKCCGLILDRDYNASINIRNEGLRLLTTS